ncbi:hypothetical protein [Terriglobus sp. RCC_193]|uniref:hypothetical protein n=1 Tax=Terriglobus sp. RCC_193 TaxID=3239218 RepID=UPI003526BFF2
MSKMLSSWKEIAHFFGKGVRTVQRWEKTLDLPIHRPPGAPSNVVLARTSDLEEWMHRGSVSRTELEGAPSTGSVAGLSVLEREVTRLASLSGIASERMDANASAEERVASMTSVVSKVNEKLASGSAVHRAA